MKRRKERAKLEKAVWPKENLWGDAKPHCRCVEHPVKPEKEQVED
jgi:hypothetical protein